MKEISTPHHQMSFSSKDKAGFVTPVSPSHSLQLLNNYMRTDLLRSIHQHIHRMKDNPQQQGSPLSYLADSLKLVIETFDGVDVYECVNQNPYQIDPGYEFDAEKNYQHDIKLMKHHLKCHRRTIKEIESGQ